jgi:hypothetical protein
MEYCHVIECDYRRVLDLWPDLLHSLIQRATTLYSTLLHTLLSTVTSSLPLLGSGIQRRKFPFLWVPRLSPCLSHPGSNSNSSQGLNCSYPLTHSLTRSPNNQLTPLTNSQAGGHLTLHSYSSNYRLRTQWKLAPVL